jgi:hypothetical protein
MHPIPANSSGYDFIRQFLECRIKVLANYQVLATGFDAAKTSTIVIYKRAASAALLLSSQKPEDKVIPLIHHRF